MSVKSLSLLFLAPAVLVATPAFAQSSDKPVQDAPPPATDVAPPQATPPAEPPPGPTPPESAAQQSKELTPPVDLATREKPPSGTPVNPWFVRSPYEIKVGNGDQTWKLQVFGFAEADYMEDTTESFNDGMNSNVLAADKSQKRNNPRGQFTIRNSRLGVKMSSPSIAGIKPSGLLETDFFGNQPGITSSSVPSGGISEAAYFNNPTWRIRHAYVKLESDVVDVLMGQMYHLLGWQNYFFGSTTAFLGLPSELFNRTTQLRLGHTFKSDAVNFDIAVAGFRPVQRDSGVPDGEAGLRLAINHWKGINTPGSGGTAAFPAAIGVSGMLRQFSVDPLSAAVLTGTAPRDKVNGWAIAADALLPIIPAKDNTDRGGALTLTGEFVVGTADADEYTGMTAGASMPLSVPGTAMGTTPASAYNPNVDPGLVAFDTNGTLHTINWRTVTTGFQFYLPPTGRVFITGNYTMADSTNIANYYVNKGNVFKASRYGDGNIFFDVTPAVRFGLSYEYLWQQFTNNSSSYNHRFELTGLYFF